MKPLASLCGGRPNLQSQRDDVQLGALTHVVEVIRNERHNNFRIQHNTVSRHVERIALTYEEEPYRDLLQYLLCVIDKLGGGDGDLSQLLDGTARLYDERHFHILRHPSWVRTIRRLGYEYLALGQYDHEDGGRVSLRVPLHHLTCYLRWGGAATAMVCHDVGCPHRHCVSPGCLRWGDLHENVQDRVGRGIYLSAVLGRQARAVAYTSELSWPCLALVGGGWVVKCAKRLSLAPCIDIMCV